MTEDEAMLLAIRQLDAAPCRSTSFIDSDGKVIEIPQFIAYPWSKQR